MGKMIIITEKPSVAQEYRAVLQLAAKGKKDGYVDGFSPVLNRNIIITWCVGHLCTLSMPDAYDQSLKKWDLAMLPFLPREYRYEVIPEMRKQFGIVKKLYHDNGLEEIYYAGDAGREGIYIQALVRQMAGHKSARQIIISIWFSVRGNRWIIRRSKSHPGICFMMRMESMCGRRKRYWMQTEIFGKDAALSRKAQFMRAICLT